MKNFTLVCCSLTIVAMVQSCKQQTPAERKFLSAANLDSAIKPGDNFFLYANGKWMDTVKIPPTEMGVGSFFDLTNSTRARLKSIIDSVSKSTNSSGSIAQKVGDFYTAAMDSATIEKRGIEPLKPYLQQIDAIKDPAGIMQYVASQQVLNKPMLFGQYFGADEKNSTINIASYYQAGLGLPDRDYYFKIDPATIAIVKAYQTYARKLFVLAGDDSTNTTKKAMQVYNLEKQLASSHKTNIELRDPQSNYHKLLVANLDKQMPNFAWKRTLDAMGVHADSVNVGQPAFFAKIDQLLKTVPIDIWKAYLELRTLGSYANMLSNGFVNTAFEYNKTLIGQQKIKPRADRMIDVTNNILGEALGQLYVKKYFSSDAKKRMLNLVNNLQTAFEARINKLEWMSDSTKTKSKEKLHSFIKKIGFPDKWRDYSKVTIDKGKYFEDRISAGKNEYAFQLAKVGKPVDRTEWGMTPPTINAYYNTSFNEIVFPAGILQFPFFDEDADDAINYGGIGMVIGHEMTHGFDDQGAQYDKNGNLKNWWSKDDSAKFAAKTKTVANLYSTFTVLDTIHIKGKLTNGENIADIGGLAIAYDAFKLTPQGKDTAKIDGLTPDQRFFLSFAQIWRIKEKDEYLRTSMNLNEHSPEIWRVNGPLMNFVPFYTAFGIKPGDKMYKADSVRIKIW